MKNVDAGNEGPDHLTEADLANEKMGNNQLEGDDQHNVHNQRQAQAEMRQDTDSIEESFEKLDKDVRAERDLGKGNMTSPAESD